MSSLKPTAKTRAWPKLWDNRAHLFDAKRWQDTRKSRPVPRRRWHIGELATTKKTKQPTGGVNDCINTVFDIGETLVAERKANERVAKIDSCARNEAVAKVYLPSWIGIDQRPVANVPVEVRVTSPVTNCIPLFPSAEVRPEDTVANHVGCHGRVPTVTAVERLHVIQGGDAGGKASREERGFAVGRVLVTLDNDAGRFGNCRDVPVTVLKSEEAFVECAVAGGVAVAKDQIVDIAQAPDELTLGGTAFGCGLLKELPLVGVVEMTCISRRARDGRSHGLVVAPSYW